MLRPQEIVLEVYPVLALCELTPNPAPAECELTPNPAPAICEVPRNLALTASGWGLSHPGSAELAGRSQTEIEVIYFVI